MQEGTGTGALCNWMDGRSERIHPGRLERVVRAWPLFLTAMGWFMRALRLSWMALGGVSAVAGREELDRTLRKRVEPGRGAIPDGNRGDIPAGERTGLENRCSCLRWSSHGEGSEVADDVPA